MRDGEKTFIVVAGGENQHHLNSVEIYDPIDNAWQPGKTNSQPQKLFSLLLSNENK